MPATWLNSDMSRSTKKRKLTCDADLCKLTGLSNLSDLSLRKVIGILRNEQQEEYNDDRNFRGHIKRVHDAILRECRGFV
jgi:hypothetical protein